LSGEKIYLDRFVRSDAAQDDVAVRMRRGLLSVDDAIIKHLGYQAVILSDLLYAIASDHVSATITYVGDAISR
jgi:hypothetical protein